MQCDMFMEHYRAIGIVNHKGMAGFVETIEKEFPYQLYSCSQDWINDKKYICKLKGAKGDVIIGWQGVHNRGCSLE